MNNRRMNSFKIKRNLEAEKFNRAVAGLIKRYWPDATVKVYDEIKGIPEPDILVEKDGLEIPIEVKTRRTGYFYLPKLRDGNNAIFYFDPISEYRMERFRLEEEKFKRQFIAYLQNYDACLFLVNGEVRPKSPCCGHYEDGFIVLSDFTTLEQSLDTIYDFLKKKKEANISQLIIKTNTR